jgi:ribosomal protein S25
MKKIMNKLIEYVDKKWPRVTLFVPRIKITLVLLLAALLIYLFAPHKQTLIIQKTPSESLTIQIDKLTTLFRSVSLLLVGFCFWLWRDVLKITGAFGMSWPEVTQQDPNDRDGGDEPPSETVPQDIPSTTTQMRQVEDQARKDQVIEMVTNGRALNVSVVAHELGITRQHAKTILYILTKEGRLRCDGFPKRALYTQADSLENLALDQFRKNIEANHKIISERRYVRVSRIYEVDAILKTDDSVHLVEVKYVRKEISPDTLDQWTMQLLTLAAQFPGQSTECHLLLVAATPELSVSTRNLTKRISFDSGKTRTTVETYDLEELKRRAQNKALDGTA